MLLLLLTMSSLQIPDTSLFCPSSPSGLSSSSMRGIRLRSCISPPSQAAAAEILALAPTAIRHPTCLNAASPVSHCLQIGLGGGQSTLDSVQQNLAGRYDSLTRAGRLPPLPQSDSSPKTPSKTPTLIEPASSSPWSRERYASSSSPKLPPTSSRLPTSASSSAAAMLQAAAAALADVKKSGTAAAISER